MNNKEWFTIRDVAIHLKLSRSHPYSLIKKGQLAATRGLKNEILVHESEIKRLEDKWRPDLWAEKVKEVISVDELAYLAGFFEGEGSVTISPRMPFMPNIKVSVGNTQLLPLERFHNIFGGVIRPEKNRPNRRPFYVWVLNGFYVLRLSPLLPFLTFKKEQLKNAITQLGQSHWRKPPCPKVTSIRQVNCPICNRMVAVNCLSRHRNLHTNPFLPEIIKLWEQGVSIRKIGRTFNRSHSNIKDILVSNGKIVNV